MGWRDLNYWIELLFRRKTAFLETAGIIFGLVALGTLLWPPIYQSTAKIFVQDNRAQLLVSPGLQTESSQNPGIVANPVSEQDLNSEVELLASVHLIKEAIVGLPLPRETAGASLMQDTVGLALQLPSSGYRLLHNAPAVDAHNHAGLVYDFYKNVNQRAGIDGNNSPITSTVHYNHYSTLRYVEDQFGLEHLGYAGQKGLQVFGSDVFTQPAP